MEDSNCSRKNNNTNFFDPKSFDFVICKIEDLLSPEKQLPVKQIQKLRQPWQQLG
jgi:hypothetical protein